jgi:hypothetical protein
MSNSHYQSVATSNPTFGTRWADLMLPNALCHGYQNRHGDPVEITPADGAVNEPRVRQSAARTRGGGEGRAPS